MEEQDRNRRDGEEQERWRRAGEMEKGRI